MLANNAISWAHFRLRGGWKSLAIISGAYGLAILTIIMITTHLPDARTRAGVLSGWVTAIMLLQAATLLLFAGSRVSHAIRTDLTSSIIESHRLMPLPPWQAVIGYLVGPAGQAFGVVVVNLVLGLALASVANYGVFEWLSANFVLISFSAFIWTVLAMMSFVTKKAFGGIGWVVGLTVFGFATQGMITALLPALAMLVSPVMGQSVFSLRPGTLELGPSYALAIAGQASIGAICFVAAARKYRRSDEAAFTPLMGLLLLLAWVGLSILGINRWEQVAPWIIRRAFRDDDVRNVQFIASLLMAMLAALIPIVGASREHTAWRRRVRLDDPALREQDRHRWTAAPAPPAMIALTAAALCLAIMLASPNPAEFARTIWGQVIESEQTRLRAMVTAVAITTAVVMSFAMTISYFVRILHRGGGTGRRVGWMVGLLIPFLWGAPMLADVIRWAMQSDDDAPVFSRVCTASPIGALIMTWGDLRDRDRVDPTSGVVAQAALAALLAGLYYGTHRHRAAPKPPAPVSLPG